MNPAEFRHAVRSLVRTSQPLCPMSTRASNEEIARPARGEVERFRARLGGTDLAALFDSARAEVEHQRSIVEIACGEPSSADPGDLESGLLLAVTRQISAIEARLGLPVSR